MEPHASLSWLALIVTPGLPLVGRRGCCANLARQRMYFTRAFQHRKPKIFPLPQRKQSRQTLGARKKEVVTEEVSFAPHQSV
jgi:hypothetical protein